LTYLPTSIPPSYHDAMSDTEPTVDASAIVPVARQIDADRGHDRETLRMLARAVRNRWPIPDDIRAAAPLIAKRIALTGNNDRERLRAIELLAALDRDNIAALVALDKVERLDGGEATERIELAPIRIGVRD
jgi:hypothetical protein